MGGKCPPHPSADARYGLSTSSHLAQLTSSKGTVLSKGVNVTYDHRQISLFEEAENEAKENESKRVKAVLQKRSQDSPQEQPSRTHARRLADLNLSSPR